MYSSAKQELCISSLRIAAPHIKNVKVSGMENSKWAINLVSAPHLSDKYYISKEDCKKEVVTFLQSAWNNLATSRLAFTSSSLFTTITFSKRWGQIP